VAYKLIRLQEGTLVEVEVPQDALEQYADGIMNKMNSSVDQLRQTLVNICRPISAAWVLISQEMQVEGADVEVGLSFEAGGDLYIAKAKTGAHFTVKLKLKPLNPTLKPPELPSGS